MCTDLFNFSCLHLLLCVCAFSVAELLVMIILCDDDGIFVLLLSSRYLLGSPLHKPYWLLWTFSSYVLISCKYIYKWQNIKQTSSQLYSHKLILALFIKKC